MKIETGGNWFGRICVVFFCVSQIVRQSSAHFAYVDLLAQCAGYALDDIYGDACKMVSDFSGSIGS